MKPQLRLEFIPIPAPDDEERHAELLDLLADGLARHLLQVARAEAEAALGRPLRSVELDQERDAPALPTRPRAPRRARAG